jgi:hypothetical protein
MPKTAKPTKKKLAEMKRLRIASAIEQIIDDAKTALREFNGGDLEYASDLLLDVQSEADFQAAEIESLPEFDVHVPRIGRT